MAGLYGQEVGRIGFSRCVMIAFPEFLVARQLQQDELVRMFLMTTGTVVPTGLSDR